MARGRPSGYTLTREDASIVLGMQARGDRDHDIAAWFGVNQGRIAEVKNGEYGTSTPAGPSDLPPSGAPGVKGRMLREEVINAITLLDRGDAAGAKTALERAESRYDADEV